MSMLGVIAFMIYSMFNSNSAAIVKKCSQTYSECSELGKLFEFYSDAMGAPCSTSFDQSWKDIGGMTLNSTSLNLQMVPHSFAIKMTHKPHEMDDQIALMLKSFVSMEVDSTWASTAKASLETIFKNFDDTDKKADATQSYLKVEAVCDYMNLFYAYTALYSNLSYMPKVSLAAIKVKCGPSGLQCDADSFGDVLYNSIYKI